MVHTQIIMIIIAAIIIIIIDLTGETKNAILGVPFRLSLHQEFL